ncbi:hypothetical protein SAMN02745975_00250 [Geosporobacter subterraneus DSM 17957]|uniref:Uncharacterized protein n=1 Tax=Geosporobacter subterraneus DSM 17957 TaxID=1121919 RepID=A0A1M6CL08_9FIRM|nr:hypothetical protein SAMN02745975_00250 [Geosporobacter subterraneus DSM 17957]
MSNIWRVTAKRPRELSVPWEEQKHFFWLLKYKMLLFRRHKKEKRV